MERLVGSAESVAEARRRAVEIHGDFRPSGPMGELLIERGIDPARVRTIVREFVRIVPELVPLAGQGFVRNLILDTEQAIEDAGGEILYQVRVLGTSKGTQCHPETEHLIDVMASNPNDAMLQAAAISSARSEMPLEIEVITDSTMTIF